MKSELIIGFVLISLVPSVFSIQGDETASNPCSPDNPYPPINASLNLTDQDFINTALDMIDDPQWWSNQTNSRNQFFCYIVMYYSNGGEYRSCEEICRLEESDCTSIWRCNRAPITTDGPEFNITFPMIYSNQSAYRPNTTPVPPTNETHSMSSLNSTTSSVNNSTTTLPGQTTMGGSASSVVGLAVGLTLGITLIMVAVVAVVMICCHRRKIGANLERDSIEDVAAIMLNTTV